MAPLWFATGLGPTSLFSMIYLVKKWIILQNFIIYSNNSI